MILINKDIENKKIKGQEIGRSFVPFLFFGKSQATRHEGTSKWIARLIILGLFLVGSPIKF